MEFAFARLSPYGSWGSVAYTQYGNLPLMQAASVTGIAGIAFLIAWFASVVNWTWEHKFEWKSIRIGLAVYSVIWILAMTLGGARPYLIHTDGKTVRVAAIGWPEGVVTQREFLRAIEPNLASEELEKLRSAFARIQDHFADASLREARAGAKIIVWPEANAMVFQDNEAALLERVQRLASGERIYLLVGMAVVHRGSARPLENKAVLIDPAGMVALSYVKAIPVPGFEARFSRNGARQLLSTDSPYGRLATAICFDMDFPGFIRQAGEAHADLFLVPASDWETIKSLHHISAVYRAIENGVPMVRATRWGLSTAVDPFGRVLGLVDPFASGDPTMVAQVPVGSVRTLYARFGDWFAWMCMAGLLSIIAWRLARHPLKSYKEPL
jgi:apolipoprotein N-acyltransferase